MKKNLAGKLLAIPGALLLTSSFAFAAPVETGFDVQLKMRAGQQLSTAQDHLTARTIGLGVDTGYSMPAGRIGFELGWSYKPGDQYLNDLNTMPQTSGMVLLKPATGTAATGVDSRKNELQGLTGRISWSSVQTQGIGYTFGLQIGGGTFRHEYLAEVFGAKTATPTVIAAHDTFNGTPTKTTVAVSPYAGVTYRFNEFSSLELNLVILRYKAIDYVHHASAFGGTATAANTNVSLDTLTTTNRSQAHLEIGYVFRF